MFDKINAWLDGKKTIIGALGIIFSALALFFTTSLADGFQVQDLIDLVKGVSEGILALGIGNKLFKLMK